MAQAIELEVPDRLNRSWREEKKRATVHRIVQVGVSLFLKQGYDATTLDQIAAEAGISRRTFFSYFHSKEALLTVWPEAGWTQVAEELARAPRTATPLQAVQEVMMSQIANMPNDELVVLSRLLRSNDSASSGPRYFANFGEREKAVRLALANVWPEPGRQQELSLVAMITVGAFRLAVETWQDYPDGKSLLELTRENFRAIEMTVRGLLNELPVSSPSRAVRKRAR